MDDAVHRIAGAWEFILPEILLIVTAAAHFLVAPFLVNERGEAAPGLRHRFGGFALVMLGVASWLWLGSRPADAVSLGPFRLDDLTWFIRGLSLATGLILLLTTWNRVADASAAEQHACLLLIVAGVSPIAAANDLVVLFLALELVSIPTYVMLYLGRHDEQGLEATLKYFMLSIFSSAFVLFGLSYLYGVTGTTNLTAMTAALAGGGTSPMPSALSIAAAAVIAGLGFRIAAVPFHFYAPDVFQGTSNGGAAMLSISPKIAGFVALVRLLTGPVGEDALWTLGERVEPTLWLLAILGMTVGNVLAFVQTDVRRMMAYSSIAHAGYMLVGIAAAPHREAQVAGVPAVLFYLAVYGAMTLGVFAILAALSRQRQPDSSASCADDLAGLGRTNPAAAVLMTVFLVSLTGLPPTAGFLGKLNLLIAAWSAGTPASRWAAALMALNAAIAAWYYLRLVGVMYLQPAPAAPRPRLETVAFTGAALCAIATLGIFTAPDWLWHAALRAAS